MGFHEQVKTYPSNYTYGFKDVLLLLLLQLRKFVGMCLVCLFTLKRLERLDEIYYLHSIDSWISRIIHRLLFIPIFRWNRDESLKLLALET